MSFLLDTEKTWVQRDFGLDKKLAKAISKLGFIYPTMVQSKTIPIVLQGKDVLVRARTGSGKTMAFALPLLHKILVQKDSAANNQASIKAIILAPTKELCKQIEQHTAAMMYYCRDNVTVCSLCDDNTTIQLYRLQAKPDIVISTPARLVSCLQSGSISLSKVSTLVIDEADLVLSFGYSDDVQAITSKMPKTFQGLLMSATLSPDLEKFKKVVLHNPAVIKLEESKEVGHLSQFFLRCTENDKFLIMYVFIKLGLLQGKGLIFVNDVNKCYKLKLFLQQFYISAAVLNAELPVNSRMHILEEYNRGVFDYLIATDTVVDHGEDDDSDDEEDETDEKMHAESDEDEDQSVSSEQDDEEGGESEEGESDDDEDNAMEDGESDSDGEDEEEENDEGDDDEEENEESTTKAVKQESKKKRKSSNEESGYGVSRGIDFQGVSFVINFDFPASSAAYTHRIGRTARGGASGTALSFVAVSPTKSSTSLLEGKAAQLAQIAEADEAMLQLVRSQQPRLGGERDGSTDVLANLGGPQHHDAEEDWEQHLQPAPLQFNMKELDSFRYRVEDTLRSVTGKSVQELRAAELKREILNSSQLKSFFAANPTDLKVLRHDKAVMHPIKQKEHLKNIPEYLVPASMRGVAGNAKKRKKRKLQASAGQSQEKRRAMSKSKDPLFSGSTTDDSAAKKSAPVTKERVYTTGDTLGRTTAGRQKWKMSHGKGKFSKHKGSTHGVKGSFTKTKGYK
jgi:ATP-dependent RNA helicase DDX56/DBP9